MSLTSEDRNPIAWALGGSGALALLGALLVNISNDANIALEVAKQHGDELNQLRISMAAMRIAIDSRTKDRYTSQDAARDLQFMERRFAELESKIESFHE